MRNKSWKHAIFMRFWQNMLENDNSNLKTKFWLHFTSNIFKITKFKNHGIAPILPIPLDIPNLKAYPIPGLGGRFKKFSLKWRERHLEQFYLFAVRFWAPGWKLFGGRCKPIRRTRVKGALNNFSWLEIFYYYYFTSLEVFAYVVTACLMLLATISFLQR